MKPKIPSGAAAVVVGCAGRGNKYSVLCIPVLEEIVSIALWCIPRETGILFGTDATGTGTVL